MMTPEQTASGLIPLIGGGGISAVLVAFIGYLAAARNGRPKAETPVISLTSATPAVDPQTTQHLGTIAYGVTRLVAIQELRAEADLKDPPGFRDRLDDKADRLLMEAMKAWLKRP